MTKKNQQLLAIILIVLGGLYLAANFLTIRPARLFWPILLILLGALLIFRPKFIAPAKTRHYFAGDIDVDTKWEPGDEELRMFAGDINIDLGVMDLPEGETKYAVRFFAGDIRLDVPQDVGLKISSTGFVVEMKMDGESQSNVMTGYEYASENYAEAERKFHLITSSFAVDIKVRTH